MLVRTLIGSALLVALYNLFFFDTTLQIGFGLLFFVANTYLFFTKKFNSILSKWGIGASLISVVFGTFVGIWDNTTVQVLDVAVALFFTGIAAYLYNADGRFSFEIPRFLLSPLMAAISGVMNTLSYALSNPLEQKHDKKHISSGLIRGLIIALPICFILMVLFTGADPVFQKYVGAITKNLSVRLISSLIVFGVAVIAGFAGIKATALEEKEVNTTGKVWELSLITGLVSTLIFLFGIIQFKYLFSSVGERELHQIGIQSLTYSEYVRRGFFELLIASGISSFVIIYILRFVDYLKGQEKRIVQTMSIILTSGIGILLASAFKRLILYKDAHGLTEARVLGFIFLVWMATILVLFVVKLLSSMNKKMFFASSLALTLTALLTLNFINVDKIVATKYPPTVNNKVDYSYLSFRTGSASLWPTMIRDAEKEIKALEAKQTFEWTDQNMYMTTNTTIYNLENQMRGLINKYGSKKERDEVSLSGELPKMNSTLLSYNVEEKRAYEVMKKGNLYKKVHELNERLNALNPKIYNYGPSTNPSDVQVSSPSAIPTFDPNTPPISATEEQMGR